MSSYIGLVSIDNQQYKIGSTLFGTCNTPANTANKRIVLSDFDQLLSGITIYIKFTFGNTVNNGVTLQFYSSNENNAEPNFNIAPISVEGKFICAANNVIAFTLEEDQGVNKWYVNNSIDITESSNNGNITVNGQDVSIHGLGTAAYTATTAYATSAQGTLAENAMPKSGGTFTGSVNFSSGTLTVPTINENSNINAAATKEYVDNKVNNILGATDAMVFKGTLDSLHDLPSPSDGYSAGWTYRVNQAGTYADKPCEIGDLVIAISDASSTASEINPNDWTVVQTNTDSAIYKGSNTLVSGNIIIADGTNGQIRDSGVSIPDNPDLTNTTYQYTLSSNTTINAYTGIAQNYDANSNNSKDLVSVSQGVLTITKGLTFSTTSTLASTTTLNESAVAGPVLSSGT